MMSTVTQQLNTNKFNNNRNYEDPSLLEFSQEASTLGLTPDYNYEQNIELFNDLGDVLFEHIETVRNPGDDIIYWNFRPVEPIVKYILTIWND